MRRLDQPSFSVKLILLVGIVAGLSACNKPCDDFADLACKTSGEDSVQCVRAREYAENAPGIEQPVCTQALELANTLKKK